MLLPRFQFGDHSCAILVRLPGRKFFPGGIYTKSAKSRIVHLQSENGLQDFVQRQAGGYVSASKCNAHVLEQEGTFDNSGEVHGGVVGGDLRDETRVDGNLVQVDGTKESTTQSLSGDPGPTTNGESGQCKVQTHSKETSRKLRLLGAKWTKIVETRLKTAHTRRGKPHSEETKRKISRSKTGKTLSDETKLKLSLSKMGKTHTDETKLKIARSRMGKIHSDETKSKMSRSRIGKKHSAATRKKMSEAAKKRKWSQEVKDRMSKTQKGRSQTLEWRMKRANKKYTAEWRKRQSESMKKYWRKKKAAEKAKEPPENLQTQENNEKVDPLVMEKALLELAEVKQHISEWLTEWYRNHDASEKPTLDDAAEASPFVYECFVRYLALIDFVKSHDRQP